MLNEAQGTAFDLFADLDITSAADGNRVEEVNQIEAKSVENYMKNVHDIKIRKRLNGGTVPPFKMHPGGTSLHSKFPQEGK